MTSSQTDIIDETKTNFDNDFHRGVRLTQRPNTDFSTRLGGMSNKTINDTVQEASWTIADVLHRYNLVGIYPIPTTASSHTVIKKLRVPTDLISGNTTTASIFDNFRFWSGKITIQGQLTASPTVQGCIGITFVPLTDQNTIDRYIVGNFSSLFLNQTIFLFPNINTAGKIEIEFNSPFTSLKVSSETTLDTLETQIGNIYITVFNPIQLSSGSTDNISLSLFSYFSNSDFKVPALLSPPTHLQIPTSMRAQSSTSTVPNLSKGKKNSEVTVFDFAYDKLMPDAFKNDTIKKISQLAVDSLPLGSLDKPDVPFPNPHSFETGPLNYSVGPNYMDKMAVDPHHIPTVKSSTFATNVDEMDMDYLKSKYSYLGTAFMATTQPAGQVIASFPVNPAPVRFTNNPEATQVPLLQYLCQFYNYYRGGIKFKCQVVSTLMQTGKLMFCYNPGTYKPLPSGNIQSAASQYGTAFEINQGSNTVEFECAYLSNSRQLYVPVSNIPSKYDTLGYINVVVINPLVSTNGSPTTISLNFFIAGADNFEFDVLSTVPSFGPVDLPLALVKAPKIKKVIRVKKYEPSDDEDIDDIEVIEMGAQSSSSFINDLPPFKYTALLEFNAQSATQPLIAPMSSVNMTDNDEDQVIAGTTDKIKTVNTHIARQTSSLRDIAKKYNFVQSFYRAPSTVTSNGNTIVEFPINTIFGRIFSLQNSRNVDINKTPHTLSRIQVLYRQFFGSLSFKMILNARSAVSIGDTFQVFYQPPVYRDDGLPTASNYTSNLDIMQNTLFFTGNSSVDVNMNARDPLLYIPSSATILPVHFVAGIQKTATFNIPYTSRLNSVILPISKDATQKENLNEYGDLGTLYFCFNEAANTTASTYDLFVSLGDEARFGTLFQVPYVRTAAEFKTVDNTLDKSAGASHYGTGSPIANTLVRL